MIRREHLLARLAGSAAAVVVAPGGFGKSTLADAVAVETGIPMAAIDVEPATGPDEIQAIAAAAFARAGCLDISESLSAAAPETSVSELLALLGARPDALLVVVDDVHNLDGDAQEWVAALVRGVVAPHRFVVLGRALPAAIEAALPEHAVHVGVDDLRFSVPEVEDYLHAVSSSAAEATTIHALTEGWPAAVALAAGRPRGSRTRSRRVGGRRDGVVAQLVAELLADLDAPDQDSLTLIAHLPRFTRELVVEVGGVSAGLALDRSGLPVNERDDGWCELPDPIREVLATSPLTRGQVAAAAKYYADVGEIGLATTLLVDDDSRDAVAEVLADRPWIELDELGLAALRATLGLLGETRLRRWPELLVKAACVAESRDPLLRTRWLGSAASVCDVGHPLRPTVLAEQARDAARRGEVDRAEALAVEVLSTAADGDVVARGRALLAFGQANTIRTTPVALARARAQLDEAVLLFRLAKERRWEADSLLWRGYAVSFHSGRFDDAAEELAQVLALLGTANRQRAIVLTYVVDVLDHLGRVHEAAAAGNEALAIGRRLGDPLIVWYAAWALMQLEGHRGDIAAFLAWEEEGTRHAGHWLETAQGSEYRMFQLDLLCALGDEARARRLRDELTPVIEAQGLEDAYAVALFRYEATFGDPEVALSMLDSLDDSSFAVERARWLRRLIAAEAARRLGDEERARDLLHAALDSAAEMGYPDLPARHEVRLMAQLAPLLPAAEAHSVGRRLQLLGGFRLEASGVDVTPQPGHPSTLVKLLALRGPMPVEELADVLWPEAEPNTGRARMRNLLNRIRSRSGEIIERRGETLSLVADLDADLAAFESLTDAVFASPPGERAGAARRAVAAYSGELLPGDRYEEWAAAPRERLRRRFLALCDLLADDAVERGDVEEALRQLDLGIAADPLDETRLLRGAELLVAQGRRAAASRMIEQAMAVAAELGLPLDGRLEALRTQVGP